MIRFPGNEIELGGAKYVFAPLNAAASKQYREQLNSVLSGAIPDLGFIAQLAHASLSRNYPNMSLAEVEELVDMGNMIPILDAITSITTLVAQMGNLVRRLEASQSPTSTS